MARVLSSGFELQSVGSSTKEWDRPYSTSNLFGSISTSIKRSGAASLRINGNIALGSGVGVAQDTHTLANNNRKTWFRTYVLFESFPTGNAAGVMGIADNTNFANVVVMINASGQAQYYWNNGTDFTAVTPLSSALNLHQWYRFEIFLDTTTSSSWSGEFRIDGATVSTFSGANGGNFVNAGCQLFSEPFAGTATGVDQYYDDAAANDANGSFQNSWPGEGKIVHLYPNAAGDNNAWRTGPTDAAGTTNNFTFVDEVNPDDGTTYIKRSTAGTPIDDYNVDTSAAAGLGASDTISVVQVGARVGANSNTSTQRDAKLRIKGQSGGTVVNGTTVFWNSTIWVTHLVVVPANYTLTTYTNPQTGAAWTPATLDTMQIGLQANTSSANEIRCSTLWALVEYIPASAVDHQGNAKLPATASIVSNMLLSGLAFSNISASSSLIAKAIEILPTFASLPCSSDISIDTLVYRPASATLPLTSAVIVNALPKFNLSIAWPLSSNLSAVAKQFWSALAALSTDSNVIANVTTQRFAALASLPIDSSFFADAKILYKTIPEPFVLTSTLTAKGLQRWSASAAYVFSSTLTANVARQNFAATSLLAASVSLLTNTIQQFVGSATLGLSSTFFAPGSAALPGVAQFDLKSYLTADTLWIQRAIAALAATATFVADTQRYVPASSVLTTTSSLLLTNTLRYVLAGAVLPGSSNLTANTKALVAASASLAGSASLDCSTILTVKHLGTAQIACSSVWNANSQRFTEYKQGVLLLTSSLIASAMVFQPAFATLPVNSTLSVTASIKDRNVSAALAGQSVLLANVTQRWITQGAYALSSDLSSFALQKWNSRAALSPTLDFQVFPVQKMFEKAKWALTSQYFASTIKIGMSRSDIILTSSLRANSIVHLVKNHAKTHKHLRGDIERMPLKAGLAEEVEG